MAKTSVASARRTRTNVPAILVTLFVALALAIAFSATLIARDAGAATAAQTKLSELVVKPAGTMTGYSRDKFLHWSDAREYGWTLPSSTPDPGSCDARDAALIRDGPGAERMGRYCAVISGTWVDPYGGRTYTNPSVRYRHRPRRTAHQRLEERGGILDHGQARKLRQSPLRPPRRGGQPECLQGRQGPGGVEAAEDLTTARTRRGGSTSSTTGSSR